MASKLPRTPSKPKSTAVDSAYLILCYSHQTCSSLLDTFENVRKSRQAWGMPTHAEQDLLRAMLAFAGSGLDSTVKQLVRDALPSVIGKDAGAGELFRLWAEREIARGDRFNAKLVVTALTDPDPKAALVGALVESLTAGSLQSKDKLFQVASYFNIPSPDLTKDIKLLESVFETRNEIIHAMDIDFTQPKRIRRPRARDLMTDHAAELLRIAGTFLHIVDTKLQQGEQRATS